MPLLFRGFTCMRPFVPVLVIGNSGLEAVHCSAATPALDRTPGPAIGEDPWFRAFSRTFVDRRRKIGRRHLSFVFRDRPHAERPVDDSKESKAVTSSASNVAGWASSTARRGTPISLGRAPSLDIGVVAGLDHPVPRGIPPIAAILAYV